MLTPKPELNLNPVATREGGVDRNMLKGFEWVCLDPSPPARVAWIETYDRVFFE